MRRTAILRLTLSTKTLYIIGNGFDLHHGVGSRYADFGKYLEKADPETYDAVDQYFYIDDSFWNEFEARLAHFDAATAIEDASDFLMPYGAEDWSDAGHHDYEYELDRIIRKISSTMRSRFADWVRQLQIPPLTQSGVAPLPIDRSGVFLNFNYTDTLTSVYGVAPARVLHLHGQARDATSQIVLGHGWRRTEADSLNHRADPEAMDTRVWQGNFIVDDYFAKTFKPTEKIIQANQAFFSALKSVETVLVMGHSLGEVDWPYLQLVWKNVSPAAQWKFSYYGNPQHTQDAAARMGIEKSRVAFHTLADADAWVP
ncbi:hypothetical protein EZ313_22005 [Ramlibacter henchirensis]|uniref:Bacteriophage abortive infection AbiH n=1 Tax=Ramlibacter henchirensis TaxID=204072 RepID=A0A4Z0BLE3_9BURK|nr:hypothetical protein EZ313_22005 [Ramlibacter henchirensis]